MKVVTEILQDLEILKRLLKHNANLKIRINYYLTLATEGDRLFQCGIVRGEKENSTGHHCMSGVCGIEHYVMIS